MDRPSTTRKKLSDALSHFPGRRGLPNLRQALALLDEHAESPKESHLRVIAALGNITGMVANRWFSTTSGSRYRIDLSIPQHKVAPRIPERVPLRPRAIAQGYDEAFAAGGRRLVCHVHQLRRPQRPGRVGVAHQAGACESSHLVILFRGGPHSWSSCPTSNGEVRRMPGWGIRVEGWWSIRVSN